MHNPVRNRVAVGLLAGVVGTLAMATAQEVITRVSPAAPSRARRLRKAGSGWLHFAQSEPRSHEQPLTTSEYLVNLVVPHATATTRRALGSLVHYGFGAAAGAAYAASLSLAPPKARNFLKSAQGLTYGVLVWLVADEIAVPLTGTAPKPHQTPARLHAYSLASHLAFGFALEQTRKLLTSKAATSAHRLESGRAGSDRGSAKELQPSS